MKLVADLTHDEIAEVGAAWLKNKGYPLTFCNMRSASHGEQPDVLGLSAYGKTFLMEAKTSRADFHADKKKPWRSKKYQAIGDTRAYITPKGLLKPEEIHYGWWLLEVHGKKKPIIKIIKGIATEKVKCEHWNGYRQQEVCRHCDREESRFFNGSGDRQPLTWMIKVLRRAQDDGIRLDKYARGNGGFKTEKKQPPIDLEEDHY